MYLNWISTASFVALNKRRVKNVFRLLYRQCKIDTASVYKLLFSSLVESATLKKDKGRLH